MRVQILAIVLGLWACSLTAQAQENVVQTFSGSNPLTTGSFKVQDKWELRWDSPDRMALTLLAPDGTIVAGTSGSLKGSLYEPKGGTFYLQISGGATGGSSPWHVSVVEIGSATAGDQANAGQNYIPPLAIPPMGSTNTTAAAIAPVTTLTPVTPPTPPPPIALTAPATPPVQTSPAGGSLTEDQAHAVVVIKGDFMEGTGFLVRTADGPAVVTNLHVISANPNIRILTTSGAQIKTLSLKGASDRDLAMFSIQDDHYTYFDPATDIKDTVQAGDEVITPGNSEGGEVVLDTKGTVLGVGPERIEVSNPIYHGNSGGPVFHSKSGKVVAVVTQAMKVNISNELDKASFENKDSAITASMRYFGLRLDTVPVWEAYDWNRFLGETTFLKNFRDISRCLDSYMNGAQYEKAHVASADENGPPNSQYYLRNEKIRAAHDNFHKYSVDADGSQKLDAGRELVIDLESIADGDMDALQNPNNFYSFDQLRAKQEVQYRKALRDEIEKFGNKISDMGH